MCRRKPRLSWFRMSKCTGAICSCHIHTFGVHIAARGTGLANLAIYSNAIFKRMQTVVSMLQSLRRHASGSQSWGCDHGTWQDYQYYLFELQLLEQDFDLKSVLKGIRKSDECRWKHRNRETGIPFRFTYFRRIKFIEYSGLQGSG